MSKPSRPLRLEDWRALILDTEVDEAANLAAQTWGPLDIWPTDQLGDALTMVEAIVTYCSSRRITALRGLAGDAETELRRTLARHAPRALPGNAKATRRHWMRNLLIGLRLTVAMSIREPAVPPQRSLDFGLHRLRPRTRWPARPLTDDEAAALRLLADLDSLHEVEPGPAALAFGLSGVTTGEISRIGADEIDFEALKVSAPGHRHGVRDRKLPLTPWSARIVAETQARRIDDVDEASTPYAYRGHQQPGKVSAHSSASGVYGRMFQRVGIAAPDLNASSVERWLPYRLLVVDGDILSAAFVSGRTFDSLLRTLNVTLDHATSYTGTTQLLDSTGQVVAMPPNKQIQPRAQKSRARPRSGPEDAGP